MKLYPSSIIRWPVAGSTTPRSVTIADTMRAGVTSNAGLKPSLPAGATRTPAYEVTSTPERSSISMSSPDAVARSTVDHGAATTNGTPASRQASMSGVLSPWREALGRLWTIDGGSARDGERAVEKIGRSLGHQNT